MRSNRASWILHVGPIPEGLIVRHKCDNTLCVNPEHLCIGTTQDNVNDRVTRGRSSKLKGQAHHCAMITEEQAREVKMQPNWRAAVSLGATFGIKKSTAQNIWYGNTWKHLVVDRKKE